MTESFFWKLFLTAFVAFSAAWAAHFFASNRDRKNKQTDQQITFLIDTYRLLESVPHQPKLDAAALESAIADIQIFGSPRQIALAQEFSTKFADTSNAPLDALIEELRKDLREELQLDEVPRKLVHLRCEKPKSQHKQ
jgi:hypothetical protein